MHGYIETAMDASGFEIRRGDFVRKASGTDRQSYKVTGLYELNGEKKAKIRTFDGVSYRKAVVLARKLLKLNGPAGKLAEMADRDRIREMSRRAEAGRPVPVVCENTLAVAVAPQPKPAPSLDRVIAARYIVELWYGERTIAHAVKDVETGEIVEQFTDRDMAHDAAREMNLR